MVKRFSGLEFWEQRFKIRPRYQNSDSDTKNDSFRSEESLDLKSPEEPSPVVTRPKWPQTIKPTDQAVQSQPIVIQRVSAVHDVRGSLSVSSSLAHPSQSASIILPQNYEDKEEFLTVVKRNELDDKKATLSPQLNEHRRTQSTTSYGMPLTRRPSLKIKTTSLSGMARSSQRHSMVSNLDFFGYNNNVHLSHRHAVDPSEECADSAECLTNQMDRAFEALTNALQDSRGTTFESTINTQTRHSSLKTPVIKMPKPLRPRAVSQQLENAQRWAESQEEYDSSTASSASSPMSPMMPIRILSNHEDHEKGLKTTEVIPMGYNLNHDLNDFLRWEERNIGVYEYSTWR